MKMIFILIISVLQISIYSQKDIDTILTEEELMNAEYFNGNVKLENGHYNLVFSAIAALDLYYIMHAYCDLNGDSLIDAIVVLLESQGSGKYPNVIPVLNNSGVPEPLKPFELSDRQDIQRIYKKNKYIYLEVLVHDEHDPMCCPSLRETWKLKFQEDRFIKVE